MLCLMKYLNGAVFLCASGIFDIALNVDGKHNIPSFLVALSWLLGLAFVVSGVVSSIAQIMSPSRRNGTDTRANRGQVENE